MNIAIIGYGKMGKEIARIAREKGHSIPLIIDVDNTSDLNAENLKAIDVAIEFSSPKTAFNNITTCLKNTTPVVSGTTGWLDKWDEAVKICEENDGTLFYASNFSIGVNILFAVNKYLADIMGRFPQYKVSMKEIHHIHKADAPSGTAISLAEQILPAMKNLEGWSLEDNDAGKIPIEAKREGEVNGYHSVRYSSDIDSITVEHNANSREGFATGAVMAAHYIKDKKGIISMNEMLNL